MLDLDALLARIQFGSTISFHIVFPALTIGLASYLAVLEARWQTGNPVFRGLHQCPWDRRLQYNGPFPHPWQENLSCRPRPPQCSPQAPSK